MWASAHGAISIRAHERRNKKYWRGEHRKKTIMQAEGKKKYLPQPAIRPTVHSQLEDEYNIFINLLQ